MAFFHKPVVIGCALAFASYSWGAGLEITQHGAKEMAHGFAGTATLLEDASVIAHNPAGLLRLNGENASIGASFLHAKIDYNAHFTSDKIESKQSSTVIPGNSRDLPGSGFGQSNMVTTIPHLYYSKRINDDAAIGVGLYVPFGSTTEFPEDWAGRFHAIESSQTAININPTFAFQATPNLSVGFGFIAQIYQALLTNQIDVGYLVAEATLETIKNDQSKGQPVVDSVVNHVLDRFASKEEYQVYNEVELSSLAYGFNFGLLWQYSDNIRFGLNYRSAISHIATGEAKRPTLDMEDFKLNFITQIQAETGLTQEEATSSLEKAFDARGAKGGDLNSHIYLPQQLALSAHWDVTPKLAVMGNATWTNWAVFEEIRLEYRDDSRRGGSDITGSGDDVRRRDLVQPLEFEDTIRLGVGLRYQPWQSIVLRTGFSVDNSPAQNPDLRTPRGPDADRRIFGVGASVRLNKSFELDVAYSKITIAKAEVSSRENPAGTQHLASGHSQGNIDNLALQVNWNF